MLMSALRVSPVYRSAHAWCVDEFPVLFPFTACLSRSRRRCSTIAVSHLYCIELGSYLVTYLTCINTSFTTLHLWSWTGRVRDHYMFLHAYGELHAPSPRFAGLISSWYSAHRHELPTLIMSFSLPLMSLRKGTRTF